MAFGGLAALWDPNEHPRGFHGRFIKKFKLAPWLDNVLRNFRPRQWHSNGQAGQYAFNLGHKSPAGAFNALDMKRVHTDWDEAQDHIRAGEIDPTTKQFMDTMDRHFQPAPEALIMGRTFTPDALGLQPQQLNVSDPNGITRFMGNTLADKGYFPAHVGTNDSHGPGKITMSLAVPQGTPIAFSGQNANDRGVFLGREQRILVTQVNPDGQGGWYMMAVVEPKGSTSQSPTELIPGRKGAGLSPAQREARISGGPSVMPQVAEPPRGESTGHQINIPDQVLPGPAQTPEQAKAAAPARAARRAGYQQARAAEGNAPQAPQPVQPQPTPPSGVGERTEPVHGPIGGTPTGGKSASEIAGTPPEPAPPAATGIQEGPPPAATFRQAFHDAKLDYPSSGPQRAEVNKALLPVMNGRGHPQDGLRMLESDIKHNERAVQDLQPDSPQARDMHDNIDKQRKIADFMAEHFNLPREGKPENAPQASTPEAPAAPAKRAFSGVKELTPTERSHYDSLDKLGKTRYLARRRAGQGHQSAFQNVKGKEAAPAVEKAPAKVAKVAKAAPTPAPEKAPAQHLSQTEKNAAAAARRAETGAEKPTVNPVNMKSGDKILVRKNDAGEWVRTTTKTGATPITVDRVERSAIHSRGRTRPGYIVHGKDENGNTISTTAHAGNTAFNRHAEKVPSAKATKTAEKAAPETVPTPAKSTVAKVAKTAPAPKAVSEVQTRADEAGLPKTVTALRQAAREKKIRGFSTMNKEQLQRALMGEEVGTGGKLGAIAPDKLTGHIQAAGTDQAARNLMEDHTVADLKALAKHNGVPNLSKLTTKDKLKDGIIKHLRGEGEGALRPTPPTESLLEGMAHNKILATGLGKEPDIQSIVAKVNDADPDALRAGRDDLEKIAEDTKTSDPIRSRIAQEAADAMGMRAQQISGVEEAPKPAKAAKVAKKAAASKLSVHQERVRKQAIADGATEEEARAAAEAAPVRAPAGTKAAVAKATKARKAAGLPTPREGGAPGPKLTAPKRAAKAATPQLARENMVPGEGGPTAPGRAAKARNLPLAREGIVPSGRTGPKIKSRDLQPGDRVMVERDSEGQLVPEMVRGDKAAFPVDVVKQNDDGSVQVKDNAGNLHNTVPEAPRGTSYRLETPTEARRAARATKASTPGISERKAKQLVPDNSVPGERAQVPIANEARQGEFDKAYKDFQGKMLRRTGLTRGTTKSQDEIANDVSRGHITPEEGIRRAESEIEINNSEIQDIARTIRRGDLSEPEIAKLRSQRDQLARDNASNERFSQFLHQHFGKEKVTPHEVTQQIAEANPNFWESLNKQDPTEFRNELEKAGFGKLEGNNAQEIFQSGIKKVIKDELDRRAAAKEATAAKKAAREAAKEAAKPEFEPGGAKYLDAKAIAGDLEIGNDVLERVQNDLNSGMTPGQAAKELDRLIQARRASNVYKNGGWHRSADQMEVTTGLRDQADVDAARARFKDAYDKEAANIDKVEQLKDRLAKARRPVVRKTTAAKATEDIQAAKEATKEPAAKKALANAETSVKQVGQEAEALKQRIIGRHQESWDKATNEKDARVAADMMRTDLTLAEIRQFFGPKGITGRSKDEILKKAIAHRFTGGDIGGEGRVSAVHNRMEQGKKLSGIANALSEVDELVANKASERAMRHRVNSRAKINNMDPSLASRLEKAAVSGDRTELDKIAQEHGLVRNTGMPGDVEPFVPGVHRGAGDSHFRKGDAVHVVAPGFQGTVEGRQFQAHPATVLEATPVEKKAMLERLGQRRAALAKTARGAPQREVTPEVAKSVNERLTRVHTANKAARARVAERGVAPTAAPAPATAPASTAPLPQRGPIKHAHVSFNENTSPATFGREDGNQPLKAPNGNWAADQGLIHMDSQIGQLWQDLAKDNRLPNSDLNKVTEIGQQLARGDINLNQAGAQLNHIRNGLTDGPLKDRFTEAVREISGPKAPEVDVPDNTPASVKEWLQKVADTPTFNKAMPGRPLRNGQTPFQELQDIVRQVSEGKRPLGAEVNLSTIGNMHESTDGYYALRRDAGKAFNTPEARKWFMTRPTGGQPEATRKGATVGELKAAKKVAPAKVTQAELKNPVAKVGNAAPLAAPSQVQAKGLTPGEGVPTANFLALKNKLPRSSELTALDTAVRIPARRAQIPELMAKIETQLSQAGVGPNDEPRKTLMAWYREHFL